MKIKIFPKVFLYTFAMMFSITLIAHILILLIAPTQNMLVTNTTISNVGVTAYSEIDMPKLISSTMLKTFPISIICCVVISLIFSFAFSKKITTPIVSIATAANQMAHMDINAKAKVSTSDEIEFLANNINALYQSLLKTIRNLELEKEQVSLAEREKLNFLQSASHELKTPVTELNATLENMILGIGEYVDYDTYLPKCKDITEHIGIMIKDILNTSHLQIEVSHEKAISFSIGEFLEELCEPYKLISETKGIQFHFAVDNDISVYLPKQLTKKAVSNILSNAVNYTESGGSIKVTLHDRTLSVYNDCIPLTTEQLQHIFEPFYRPDYSRDKNTGGNGFGLYIVETILRKLQLKYKFLPSQQNNGMNFIIVF